MTTIAMIASSISFEKVVAMFAIHAIAIAAATPLRCPLGICGHFRDPPPGLQHRRFDHTRDFMHGHPQHLGNPFWCRLYEAAQPDLHPRHQEIPGSHEGSEGVGSSGKNMGRISQRDQMSAHRCRFWALRRLPLRGIVAVLLTRSSEISGISFVVVCCYIGVEA